WTQVTHVVIDEVDTMLTQGFGPDIRALTAPLLAPRRGEGGAGAKGGIGGEGGRGKQFVFVTATLTNAVRRLLEDGDFPKV
ncbi:unnamed protein product, partial [Discosporangium mesarthrocarpum]